MLIVPKIKGKKRHGDMVWTIWNKEFYILQHNGTHGFCNEPIFFLDWHKVNNKGF